MEFRGRKSVWQAVRDALDGCKGISRFPSAAKRGDRGLIRTATSLALALWEEEHFEVAEGGRPRTGILGNGYVNYKRCSVLIKTRDCMHTIKHSCPRARTLRRW